MSSVTRQPSIHSHGLSMLQSRGFGAHHTHDDSQVSHSKPPAATMQNREPHRQEAGGKHHRSFQEYRDMLIQRSLMHAAEDETSDEVGLLLCTLIWMPPSPSNTLPLSATSLHIGLRGTPMTWVPGTPPKPEPHLHHLQEYSTETQWSCMPHLQPLTFGNPASLPSKNAWWRQQLRRAQADDMHEQMYMQLAHNQLYLAGMALSPSVCMGAGTWNPHTQHQMQPY